MNQTYEIKLDTDKALDEAIEAINKEVDGGIKND